MSQENLQTMIMQHFWGGKRSVLWDCASSECKFIFAQECYLVFTWRLSKHLSVKHVFMERMGFALIDTRKN